MTSLLNNTSCNQPKVVLEPEILASRGIERQHGVGDTQAAWQYVVDTGVPSLHPGC